MKIDNARIVKH